MKPHLRFPAKFFLRFACIADQKIHLGRTIVLLIDLDMFLPIQLQTIEAEFEHFLDGMRFAGGNDVIVGDLRL